ncbi:ubiquinol--cytochrome-c reductase chain [Zalerion maritima]|uniref:Cytochrome b-c1 complex subunit 8 n=1 Tax=Zalerion maritima TaxID=339359 RepID=A0AAD5WW36_9PEZI|nr:ubiquinol--cytochrome-c reductase chain [Zalerion maritima]
MRPSMILRGGGGDAPLGKYGKYIGGWGNLGVGIKQRGIIQYGLAPNRQKLFPGLMTDGVYNTFRRVRGQILYFIPFVVYYFINEWATERNEYLNSKAGRAEFSGEEEEE